MRMGSRLTIRKADGVCRVPKNSVSRSKRLLKPQPLPHQYWGLELRASPTRAGDGAECGAKLADTLDFNRLPIREKVQIDGAYGFLIANT